MKQDLLQKLQKYFLFSAIILLPFTHLPQRFIIKSFGTNASNYMLLIALLLFIYEYYKYRFQINKIILHFFIIYFLSQVISLFHGLIIYPYYDLLDINQLQKLEYITSKVNLSIDKDILIANFLFLKETKNIFLNSVFFCFIPMLFIHLFSNDYPKAFSFLKKAVIVLICLFGLYSIPEIMYLKFGNPIATKILETINPFLYDIGAWHGWWPPLLWTDNGGRLRSLCTEPSCFCIIFVFCIPFLLNIIYKKLSVKHIALFIYFMLMLFMTKSRTGLVIFSIQAFILLLFLLYKFSRKNFIFSIIIISCISFSMFLNLKTNNNETINKSDNTKVLSEYIDENVLSAIKPKARSNTARFENIISTTKVGLQHPILGVGKSLKDAYIFNNLPEVHNTEIKTWKKLFKEKVLNSPFPIVNQYALVLAENGFLGLFIFIVPIIYFFCQIFIYRMKLNNIEFLTLFIIFTGQLLAMLTGAFFMTYPLCLGLLFIYFDNLKKFIITN